jgi:hypothetical protein
MKKKPLADPAIFLYDHLPLAQLGDFLKPNIDSDDFRELVQVDLLSHLCALDGLMVGVGIAAIYRFRASWLARLNRFANR